MVNIVVCGPGGSQKHKLIDGIIRRCNKQVKRHRLILNVPSEVFHTFGIQSRTDFHCDDQRYYTVQSDIIARQCNAENTKTVYTHTRNTPCSENFITDNCIINSLAHASKCLYDTNVVDHLLHENPIALESLERYRFSLVLLVGPCEFSRDDGLEIKLKRDDWTDFKQTYVRLFQKFKITFIDLTCTELMERVDTVHQALNGKFKLVTSNLAFYKPKQNSENQAVQTNFSFCRDRCNVEDCISIPTIKISEHMYEQDWTSYKKGETSRFIDAHGHENLVLLSFDINVTSKTTQKMLINGISINGDHYSFLGCSASGLKNRKCFMWKGTQKEVHKILLQNSDFEAIRTVSKQLARVGLLFSAVTLTDVKVGEQDVVQMDDIELDGHNFSDGCGGISKAMAKRIFSQLKDSSHDDNYLPSVYQVRFQGCKGVLALNNNIAATQIMIRPSMKKFSTTRFPCVGVCEYSRAYTFGHLNKQFIMLLSGLGIHDEIFEEKQMRYLELIESMLVEPESAITILQWQNMFHVAQMIVQKGNMTSLSEDLKQIVMQTLQATQQKLVSKLSKLSIVIPKSRYIFGVCDTSNTLKYGECFLRITESSKPKTIRGQIVVGKNPCYLLGDLRVLTAVDDTDKPDIVQLQHLVDCIVFPSCGRMPHSKEIAGSDLDGDQYFVTWDEDLIPAATRLPYDYPSASTRPQGPITNETKISYFSQQNETQKMIGRIDGYFNRWADIKNVTSTECERLGQLFSRVIDAGKSGEEVDIPKGLRPHDTLEEDTGRFVWGRMKTKAHEFEEQFKTGIISGRHGSLCRNEISTEFALEITQQKYSNITEFEKFKFAWNHTQFFTEKNEDTVSYIIENYVGHINFAMFTVDEKRYAIDIGIPIKYVMNALNKSKILSEDVLEHFQMLTPNSPWSRYVQVERSEFDWSHLMKALTTNDHVLLVLEMPDDVILVLQFLEKQMTGEDQIVKPGTISGILYSRHFGYKMRYILGPKYTLDFTSDTLQLYREQKPLTFVWLKATDRKMTKRRWNKRVSDEVVNSISVNLLRFNSQIFKTDRPHPLINKVPFVRIEIYAQKRYGCIPYWDNIDANDLLPVTETVDQEHEDEDKTQIDFRQLFPELEIEDEFSSQDDFFDALRNAARKGNPYSFKAVLQHWKENELPEDVQIYLPLLLENIVVKVIPRCLPDTLQNVLIEIITHVASALADPCTILSVAGLLCRLHLGDIAKQIVQRQCNTETSSTSRTGNIGTDMHVSFELVLQVLENWQAFWFLESLAAKIFLSKLLESVSRYVLSSMDEDQPEIFWKHRYLCHYGILNALSLLADMDNKKEKIGQKETQNCILYLKLDSTADQKPSVLSFYRTSAIEYTTHITQGQYVAISRHCDVAGNGFHRAVCCVGQVTKLRLTPFTMSVKLSCEIPDIVVSCLSTGILRYWRVDLMANIITYMRVGVALKYFASADPRGGLLSYLIHPLGHKTVSTYQGHKAAGNFPEIQQETLPEDIEFDTLNVKQREAVCVALKQNISIIQGPPGTGKTKVACHVIKHAWQRYSGVLVVAETNVAVDNIAKRLRNDLLIVRVGSTESISTDLFDVSLQGQVKMLADREAKRTTFRDEQGETHRNTRLVNKIISAADVVLTTCAGAGDISIESYKFEFVLVDEAMLTMETTLLCCLAHGAKHLVMIGDPKQLGPVIPEKERDQVRSKIANLPKLSELSQTLFHRLFHAMPHCFLDTQHRMHPDIMTFPSNEFYDMKLKAEESLSSRPEVIFPWPEKEGIRKSLCFINVEGREIRKGTSYCNFKEIEMVQRVTDVLLTIDEKKYREYRLSIEDIGILTLYQGQVAELKNKITHCVTISSVDGFQGQEKEVIIVSTVRCNDMMSVGFSGDEKRINVLLTRAKRGLIVIGNERTLRASDIWKRWIKDAPKLKIGNIKPVM